MEGEKLECEEKEKRCGEGKLGGGCVRCKKEERSWEEEKEEEEEEEEELGRRGEGNRRTQRESEGGEEGVGREEVRSQTMYMYIANFHQPLALQLRFVTVFLLS